MFDHTAGSVLDAPMMRDNTTTGAQRDQASFDAFDPFELSFDGARERTGVDAGEFGTP